MKRINLPWLAAWHISLYFSANAFKACLPFFVLPVLTRYIPPAEYGVWGVYTALLSLLAPVTALGLTTIIGRNYHLKSPDQHAGQTYMAAMLIGAASLILLLIVGMVGIFTGKIFGVPVALLYLMPFLCFFMNFDYLYKIILRHQGKAIVYVAMEVASALVFRIGSLLVVLYVAANWTSLLYTQVVSALLFFAAAFYLMRTGGLIRPEWRKEDAVEMMNMGWPLIPHALGGVVMVFSDRIVLERMMDMEAVGVYSVAATMGGAVLLFSASFNNAWGPWMQKELRRPTYERKLKIVRYTYLYFMAMFFLTVGIIGASYFYIHYFLDSAYYAAFEIAAWLAAGTAFFGMSYALTHYLIVLGKTRILPVVTGLSALLNVCLTILLVDLNGAIGAAQATFIAYFVFLVALLWQSQKHYPMPWLLRNESSAQT